MSVLRRPWARESWAGKRVLVTGHTGFKGVWLTLWLAQLGAKVYGLALPPDTDPSLFGEALTSDDVIHSVVDLRDLEGVTHCVTAAAPEVVFHLAAQPLVLRSYSEPTQTFATNVMGTVHLLHALRQMPTIRAIVVVTSDKAYANREWVWAYREDEALGGQDPYSATIRSAGTSMVRIRAATSRPKKHTSVVTPLSRATAATL